jgi:parvulin-like peptidyl-prolyl isomerase
MAIGGVCVLAACVAIRYYWGANPAEAEPRAYSDQAAGADSQGGNTASARVVATVNGEEITRAELAQECLRHYGKEVLEGLLNKYLIVQECQRQGVTVTQGEVNREIERFAKLYKVPVDQWLKMLKQERGITAEQYASDFIWPMLALRKLAREQLQVTAEELRREYEMRFGKAIKARLIACQTAEKAQKVRALAVANPGEFGNLAKQHSEDPSSASLKGLIQPICRHAGNPEIEKIAFSLKDGEISPVIQVADQYIILQRESEIPERNVAFEDVRPGLEEGIRERKHRSVAMQIYQRLLEQAKKQGGVVNTLADPQLASRYPGVAAVVAGRQITLRELADRCIERHGEEVLDGTINRRLLEQACRKQKITVTEADLDQEIARAAAARLKPRPDGKPDVEAWIELVTRQQGISVEVYRRDSVWPSVALRKLVGGRVQVTDEDLQKGYEANYGPRVRCLAIVLGDLRSAQRVWEMARQNPSREYFGQLAAQYSVEPGSRVLKGEVPPIQKYGGQPLLEDEAFRLKPGEMSGVIQVEADKYVILLCEGYTKPQKIDFAAVRNDIYDDIHEKRLRLAMAEYFSQLQDEASIDNYLANTSRSPKRNADRSASATSPVKAASRGRPAR